MGEHQCTECGHITTGFEQQEFAAKAAAVERLRAALVMARSVRMWDNLPAEDIAEIDAAIAASAQ